MHILNSSIHNTSNLSLESVAPPQDHQFQLTIPPPPRLFQVAIGSRYLHDCRNPSRLHEDTPSSIILKLQIGLPGEGTQGSVPSRSSRWSSWRLQRDTGRWMIATIQGVHTKPQAARIFCSNEPNSLQFFVQRVRRSQTCSRRENSIRPSDFRESGVHSNQ